MPIILIWNAAIGPFEGIAERLLKEIGVAGGSLGKFLAKQISQGEKIERQTAGFPIFRFYNGAISAEIGSLQHGILTPAPDMTMRGQMERVGRAWNIPQYVSNRYDEAVLIHRLVDVFVNLSGGIVASIDRWAEPKPEQFDPDNARVGDLPGLAALLFNTVARNRAGILAAGKALHEGLQPPSSADEPGDALVNQAEQAAQEEATPEQSLERQISGFADTADEVTRMLAAALMVIPAIGGLFLEIAGDALQRFRLTALDHFESIERELWAWRRDFLGSFYRGLHGFVDGALLVMLAVRDHMLGQLRYFTLFAQSYIAAFTQGLVDFIPRFEAFWNHVADLLEASIVFIDQVMGIDIGHVLHHAYKIFESLIGFLGDHTYGILDDAPEYEAPAYERVSLGDFFTSEGSGARARTRLGNAAETLLETIRGGDPFSVGLYLAMGTRITGIHLGGLAGGVIALLQKLDEHRPGPVPSQGNAPVIPTLPNLDAEFIEPARIAVLGFTAQAAAQAQVSVGNTLHGVETFANGIAQNLHRQAIRSRRLGSLDQYQSLVSEAEDFVRRAFPDTPSSATGLEAVAEAFSLWLSGSFEMLGSIIDGYLSFLLEMWSSEIDANEDLTFEATPTSPRKLLARAQLGRVRVPEMRIIVNADTVSREAANDIAQSFRSAVRTAYSDGHALLESRRPPAASQAASGG